jgi:hypothetical protein
MKLVLKIETLGTHQGNEAWLDGLRDGMEGRVRDDYWVGHSTYENAYLVGEQMRKTAIQEGVVIIGMTAKVL